MQDDTAPATKADLNGFMEHIDRSLKELYEANERWKEEILRHFDVVVENIRHDLEGAHRDRIELMKDRLDNHEARITTLERHPELLV